MGGHHGRYGQGGTRIGSRFAPNPAAPPSNVAVLDASGNVLAHGANEKLVGKSLAQLKDADGKAFVQEIMGHVTANKPGWVDYRWVNPVSKEIEAKSSFVEVQGGYGFMVGAYSK